MSSLPVPVVRRILTRRNVAVKPLAEPTKEIPVVAKPVTRSAPRTPAVSRTDPVVHIQKNGKVKRDKNYSKQPDGRFKCSKCDKISDKQNTMSIHVKTKHTDEREFPCPHKCLDKQKVEKSFVQKSALEAHIAAKHAIDNKKEKHSCGVDDCEVSCSTVSNLCVHIMRIHNREECDKYMENVMHNNKSLCRCTHCDGKPYGSPTAFFYHAWTCFGPGIVQQDLPEPLAVVTRPPTARMNISTRTVTNPTSNDIAIPKTPKATPKTPKATPKTPISNVVKLPKTPKATTPKTTTMPNTTPKTPKATNSFVSLHPLE